MSLFLADLVIWALLFLGIIFAGIGLMGLMLFPDTKSRMFTAFRATVIGLGSVAGAVIVYAGALLATSGGEQYTALILRTFILVLVLAAGTGIMYRIIRARTSGAD